MRKSWGKSLPLSTFFVSFRSSPYPFFCMSCFNQCWQMIVHMIFVLNIQFSQPCYLHWQTLSEHKRKVQKRGLILQAHCKESIVYFKTNEIFLSWLICLYFSLRKTWAKFIWCYLVQTSSEHHNHHIMSQRNFKPLD